MELERVRKRVREIVSIPSEPDDVAGRMFDALIVTLIILNTIAVIVESIPGFLDGWEAWFHAFELFSIAVFIAEYLLRLWSVTVEPEYSEPVAGRLRWMASPFAVIDLLAILPALLFALDLRFLRVLRVLRILKIGRYAESFQILGNVVRRSRRDLLTSLFMVMLALILTSSLMYYAEREAQPVAFESIPGAMWWSIVALTTTGYGDIVPITLVGRILGGITALLGVASIALPVGILSSSFVQEIESRRKKDRMSASVLATALNEGLAIRRKASVCPHCGKDIKKEKPVSLP